MMSRGFKLNVKLNRKIENSCLLTNLLQSRRWLLWRHSCGHWRYPGCCGYFRCHSLFPLQPADPAPCHFLRAGGKMMLHSKLAEVLLSSNCKTVCLCTNICVIYSWLLRNLEFLSYRPHHAHHAVLLPQHFPLPVPPGHHDGLPHLLLLPQLQPKRRMTNVELIILIINNISFQHRIPQAKSIRKKLNCFYKTTSNNQWK